MLSNTIFAYLNLISNRSLQKFTATTLLKYNRNNQIYTKMCCFLSSKTSQDEVPKPQPSKLKKYLLGRYATYLDKFQDSLANEMPDTARMLRIFSKGLKEYVLDVKDLIQVTVKLSLPMYKWEMMSSKEMYTYYFMPWQMVKVLPVLVLSAVPLGQYFVFPIAFMFPKTLLSYHFWDSDQKIIFGVESLQLRLYNARPVFRIIQDRVEDITFPEEKQKCLQLFHALGSGLHLSTEEIMSLAQLFRSHPYSLDHMYSSHVKALIRLHGLSMFLPRRRRRLRHHVLCVQSLDYAIFREGIESFSTEQLKAMLIFRGLNPSELSYAEITEYLRTWVNISKSIGVNRNSSLILHLPIFMVYNHPRNLELIYK